MGYRMSGPRTPAAGRPPLARASRTTESVCAHDRHPVRPQLAHRGLSDCRLHRHRPIRRVVIEALDHPVRVEPLVRGQQSLDGPLALCHLRFAPLRACHAPHDRATIRPGLTTHQNARSLSPPSEGLGLPPSPFGHSAARDQFGTLAAAERQEDIRMGWACTAVCFTTSRSTPLSATHDQRHGVVGSGLRRHARPDGHARALHPWTTPRLRTGSVFKMSEAG
jgi:hypothetical protein